LTVGLLHDLLGAAARRDGERPAVADGVRTVTYGELDERANRLARLLRDRGIWRGDRVGIYLEKSLEAVVAIYGTLRAGAAYVPLDPSAPVVRLAYIARNAELRCVLTGIEKAETWPGLMAEGAPLETLVALNVGEHEAVPVVERVAVLPAAALDAYDASPPDVDVGLSDLAYILYTSGSTGKPKGVMLSHRNALAFVEWAVGEIGVTASDRVSSHAPFHFDLSVFDLYAAAAAGAPVVLVPPTLSVFPVELARFIANAGITVWYSVPSILSMLASRGRLESIDLSALRAIIFAGEVFPTKYLFQLMRLVPRARFHNWYGPTETNVCTAYPVPPLDECPHDLPIGRAIAGVEAFAVTDVGQRAAQGDVGELHVTGPTVMQGYWADSQRTAQSLIKNAEGGWPTYKTGDLVRECSDGNLLFLGRRDAQIKSRGYRIELGEIEAVLHGHPAVVECAVRAVPDELVTNRIKAYVVVRNGVDETALVQFCQSQLSQHMVPEIFEFRDQLPKTSTGKIARTELDASPPT
jgi:amino acid adenylation domain-containing protein